MIGHVMVNMSHWGGQLTAQEARCLRDSGCQIVSPGSGRGNYGAYLKQQSEAAYAAGMDVWPYIYIEFVPDYLAQVHAALGQFATLSRRPPVVWVDIEDTKNGKAWSPAQRAAATRACLELVSSAGYRAGLYTALWYWRPHMADTREFSSYPLWDAHYDGQPFAGFRPYGGWARAAAHQWHDTTTICGQSLQPNFVEPWFRAEIAGGGDPMTPQERAEFEALKAEVKRLSDESRFHKTFAAGTPGPFAQSEATAHRRYVDAHALMQEGLRGSQAEILQSCVVGLEEVRRRLELHIDDDHPAAAAPEEGPTAYTLAGDVMLMRKKSQPTPPTPSE